MIFLFERLAPFLLPAKICGESNGWQVNCENNAHCDVFFFFEILTKFKLKRPFEFWQKPARPRGRVTIDTRPRQWPHSSKCQRARCECQRAKWTWLSPSGSTRGTAPQQNGAATWFLRWFQSHVARPLCLNLESNRHFRLNSSCRSGNVDILV